jgi:asparagine synthase (glutamine-hydrolysing)
MKDTWTRVLPRYFRGQEQVALSLTGGVDSRMILAWAPRPAGTLPCYTFGSRYRDCADVKISREVARICKQSHEVIQIGSEFLSQFPELAEKTVYISDGAMNVTGTIDLYVQQRERQIAPVRITGTNGGEILRSLVAFKPASLCHDVLDPELVCHAHTAAVTYADEFKGHRLSFTAFKQAPWHMGCKFVIERSHVTLRMPYFDNELIALVYQSPAEYATDNRLSQRLIQDGNPALGRIPTDRGRSLESLPYVADVRHLFQEFLFKAEYAYDYGMPQWLAGIDHTLAPLRLERLFLGRHKFHHFRVFYRDELSVYLKDMLLDSQVRSRSYLRGGVVERMVNGHTKGNRNYTLALHKLLTTELIHRQFLDCN